MKMSGNVEKRNVPPANCHKIHNRLPDRYKT
jgi:hypothetical protein